jgi:hypothetical protein
MATVTLELDTRTENNLNSLSASEGVPASEIAVRLLRRAIRSQRPRPSVDWEAVRIHAAEFAAEDLALADSDREHRAVPLASLEL